MVSPNEVDICVTCVTDKPPKLPLREELVSLGVEVIYKANGVGAQAVRSESKRNVMEYREQVQSKKKSLRLFPKTTDQKMEKKQRHEKIEQEILSNNVGLSYEAYSQRLIQSNSSGAESGCDLPSYGASKVDQLGAIAEDRDGAVSPVRNDYDARDQSKPHDGSNGKAYTSSSKFGQFSPISNATSPTHSITSFGTDFDAMSPVRDDNSTFQKDSGKVLVSATGNRWWYEQNDERIAEGASGGLTPTVPYSGQHNSPPPIPSLMEDTRRDDLQSSSEVAKERVDMSGKQSTLASCTQLCGCETKVKGDGIDHDDISGNGKTPIHPSPNVISNDVLQSTTPIHVSTSSNDVPSIFCGLFQICDNRNKDHSNKVGDQEHVVNTTINSDTTDLVSNIFFGTDAIISNRSYDTDEGNNGGPAHLSEETESKSRDLLEDVSSASSSTSGESDTTQLLSVPSALQVLGHQSEGRISSSVGKSRRELFSMISSSTVPINEIQEEFRRSPTLARAMARRSGKVALHAACDREFPDRFSDRSVTLVKKTLDLLIADIIEWRSVVDAILVFNVEACKTIDKSGDLPVHIAGRRLIEWEGQWRTRFAGVSPLDEIDACKIDKLYLEMSQTIEIVLDPIISSRGLCRKRGSVGVILPLHLACMFAVSSDRISSLLCTYSEAASIPCDLADLLTLVGNRCLPLELLVRERAISRRIKPDESVSEGFSFVSDLLFSFHPDIEPFRSDPERLARIESLVTKATRRLRDEKRLDEQATMDPAAKAVWIWLCSSDRDNESGCYAQHVANIVYNLELEEVKLLANMETCSGPILSVASQACASAIKVRLNGIMMNQSPELKTVPNPSSPCQARNAIDSSTSLLPGSISRQLSKDSCFNHGTSGSIFGAMLKNVFNVREGGHPSTFIILPYKLVTGANGSLTLDTPTSAPVALKFAQYLLEMTQPVFLNHQLEKKALQHGAFKLPADQMEDWTLKEEQNRNIQRELLDLYRYGPAYLYLLDEKDSVPIVKGDKGEKYYPIRIEDPVDTVRRMLPLMLMGMVHMRGHKSLSTLAKTIMEGGLSVPEDWMATATSILELLSVDTGDQNTVVSAAMSCKENLETFVNSYIRGNGKHRTNATEDGFEWVVELTLLKLILERSDIRRSFAGLRCVKMPNGEIVWSKNKIEVSAFAIRRNKLATIDCSHSILDTCAVEDLHPVPSLSSIDLEELLSDGKLQFSKSNSESETSPSSLVLIDSVRSILSRGSICKTASSNQRPPTPNKSAACSKSIDSFGSKNSRRHSDNSIETEKRGPTFRVRSKSLDSAFSTRSVAASIGSRLEDPVANTWTHLAWSSSNDLDQILNDDNIQPTLLSRASSQATRERSVSVDSGISSQTRGSNDCVVPKNSRNWRHQLELQEAKLDNIRNRLSALDVSDEDQVSLRGEKLLDDLSQQLSLYDASSATVYCDEEDEGELDIDEGVDFTKKLMIRLCVLEERLLSREIDLEQIKLDLHNFELEALTRSDDWGLTNSLLEVD